MAGLGEEVFSRDRSPRAGGIKFPVAERFAFPAFANGIDDAPGSFNFIATDEKCGIAGKRFEQEPFVGFGGVGSEFAVVAEMHSDRTNLQARAGNFAIETKGYALVGLQAQCDGVGIECLAALRREKDVRGVAKLHTHFAGAERKRFAGAEIKWNAGPAPVIDPEF